MVESAISSMSKIVSFLERDRLSNITLLKMIETYGEQMEGYFFEKGPSLRGILLLLPVEACKYDILTYPGADYVVFMDCTDVEAVPELVRCIPAGSNLVFKLHREAVKRRLSEYFALERVRTFTSYTSPGNRKFEPHSEVAVSSRPDANIVPLWLSNGYGREEIEHFFRNGAFSFTVYRDQQPVSTGIAFQNYREIWEIGAVHTLEHWRGRGFAGKVVNTALHHLLERGLTPRYHVLETNIPSIKLAESVGLMPFMKLDHYICSEKRDPLKKSEHFE